MNSPMLDAFLKNQKFTDEDADRIKLEQQQLQQNKEKEAIQQLSRSQRISEYTSIPTKIKDKELNETPKSHPSFEKYDHSLEMPRIKYNVDGAEILSEGVTIPEPEPEKLRLNPSK